MMRLWDVRGVMLEHLTDPRRDAQREEPFPHRDLRRWSVVRVCAADDLREVARAYVHALEVGPKVKQAVDTLARFIGALAALPGVEALALASSCQSGCRPALANCVFTRWERGTDATAQAVRAVARANAELFGGVVPLLPNGGLSFIHLGDVDLEIAEQRFAEQLHSDATQHLLGLLTFERS